MYFRKILVILNKKKKKNVSEIVDPLDLDFEYTTLHSRFRTYLLLYYRH